MKLCRYILYFIKNAWFVLLYKLFKIKKKCTRFCGKKNISVSYSDDVLFQKIVKNEPFMAVRYGAVEISCLNNYEKINMKLKKTFKKRVRYSMKNNAGFFPCNDENLKKYAETMNEIMKETDVLGISGIHMEDYFYKKHCKSATVIQYFAFEPINKKWIKALNNKKVLIISPFKDDILKQIKKKDYLEDLKDLTCEFIVVEAIQSIGNNEVPFNSWFDSLKYMQDEISKLDFDIALVGAGAYGTPLCYYIKKLGKQAIQTGGATPLLFGIVGRRWEKRDYVIPKMNEHWIHPSTKPQGFEKVEKGCYW